MQNQRTTEIDTHCDPEVDDYYLDLCLSDDDVPEDASKQRRAANASSDSISQDHVIQYENSDSGTHGFLTHAKYNVDLPLRTHTARHTTNAFSNSASEHSQKRKSPSQLTLLTYENSHTALGAATDEPFQLTNWEQKCFWLEVMEFETASSDQYREAEVELAALEADSNYQSFPTIAPEGLYMYAEMDVSWFVDIFAYKMRRATAPIDLTPAGKAAIQRRIDEALHKEKYDVLPTDVKQRLVQLGRSLSANYGFSHFCSIREFGDGAWELGEIADEELLRTHFGLKEVAEWINAEFYGVPNKDFPGVAPRPQAHQLTDLYDEGGTIDQYDRDITFIVKLNPLNAATQYSANAMKLFQALLRGSAPAAPYTGTLSTSRSFVNDAPKSVAAMPTYQSSPNLVPYNFVLPLRPTNDERAKFAKKLAPNKLVLPFRSVSGQHAKFANKLIPNEFVLPLRPVNGERAKSANKREFGSVSQPITLTRPDTPHNPLLSQEEMFATAQGQPKISAMHCLRMTRTRKHSDASDDNVKPRRGPARRVKKTPDNKPTDANTEHRYSLRRSPYRVMKAYRR